MADRPLDDLDMLVLTFPEPASTGVPAPDRPSGPVPQPFVDMLLNLAGMPDRDAGYDDWAWQVRKAADLLHGHGWTAGFHAGKVAAGKPTVLIVTDPGPPRFRALPAGEPPQSTGRGTLNGLDGWADSDAGAAFLMLGEQLLRSGFTRPQAVRFLERALRAGLREAQVSRAAA